MKKYLAVIAGIILLTTMIQMVEYEWVGYEWVESCYGIECTDREPRGDWDYSATYCKKWITLNLGDWYVKIPPSCYI